MTTRLPECRRSGHYHRTSFKVRAYYCISAFFHVARTMINGYLPQGPTRHVRICCNSQDQSRTSLSADQQSFPLQPYPLEQWHQASWPSGQPDTAHDAQTPQGVQYSTHESMHIHDLQSVHAVLQDMTNSVDLHPGIGATPYGMLPLGQLDQTQQMPLQVGFCAYAGPFEFPISCLDGS